MIRETIPFGAAELTLETGRMAKQANGSVLVTHGETVVLVTAVASKDARPGAEFFPLTVEYVEKTYAAGKIPGGYLKRESKQSTPEILMCRIIDRPIRPLFPEGFRCETQVIATVMSADRENDPAIAAIIGAGAALSLSDIPFDGPVAGCRVGRIGGEFRLNPTFAQMEESDLDLVVVSAPTGIVMVEGSGQFVAESVVVDALQFAEEQLKPMLKLIDKMRKAVGKEKRIFTTPPVDADLQAALAKLVSGPLADAIQISDKQQRYSTLSAVYKSAYEQLVKEKGEGIAAKAAELKEHYEHLKGQFLRKLVLEQGRRIDGRKTQEVRPISIETGVLPRTHGSALFTRGETQALVTVTLGTSHDEQRVDDLNGDWKKSFMLHYNFPPFSVGEAKMLRGPSRRDIGHGALAERGVERILPIKDDFPYCLRVVSEVLESNGSSSMATVCGASLALMDAGVPVSGPVAGVAMGLIKEGRQYAVLTDILGDEDHLGDMDFKVVGNRDGISSVQMDIKIKGLTKKIMESALEQAKAGRVHILDKMEEALAAPRESMSPYAPRIFKVLINPDRIRDLIGPGGKHIKGIAEQTGASIEVNDSGTVLVACVDIRAAEEAIHLIKSYTEECEVGRIYLGTVVKCTDFGAFVQILPGTDGLVHISELSHKRVKSVDEVVKEGDEILVKVLDIDRSGKIRLSRKEALAQAN